ncbi:MAG TPA: N-acetylneuraminate synthase family protein, partial [Gemmatimonadales bacterium]|nr:N-acetylneuraminate synthase family protein [Gemmatimonadales bacterium]
RTGKPIILSSGLTGLDEIRAARDRIRSAWRAIGVEQDLAILHCVVSYPTPPEQANLAAIRALASLGETVGYSDHTLGIDAAVLSVPLGAHIIEKHFTISKTRSAFRDHQLSADPSDLAELVRRVREAELLLGDGIKRVLPAETAGRTAARRSIVARRGLAAGQVLGWEDLDWVRPGTGLPPGRESELVGGRLRARVGQGTQLCPEELEFPVCPVCASADAELLTIVTTPPPREKNYGVPAERYRRALYRCQDCGAFINWHGMLAGDYYRGDYNQACWPDRLLEPFRRIRALPPDESDNKQRVARVVRHLSNRGCSPGSTRTLDIGSGLCVFLAELGDQWGGELVCVDPDPAAAAHALEHAGVSAAHAGTLDDFAPGIGFDLVTFNKVLEHVPDPVRLLGQARSLLATGGTVYLELPDGELALEHGRLSERQEFFAEHLAVYTRSAVERLVGNAGFRAIETASLHEPSGKCTVYAFLEPLQEPA